MVTLVFNIAFDLVFILTNRRYKVSTLPERTFGELLGLFLDPRTRFAFEYLHKICHRVFGRYGDIEVYMLISNMPGMYVTLFPLCNVFELSFQFLFNVCVPEYRSAILWTPHYVVVTYPCGVGLLIESTVHG